MQNGPGDKPQKLMSLFKKISPEPNRLVTSLVLSVIFGFASAAVGVLFSVTYLTPSPEPSASYVPRASLAVNRMDTPRLAADSSASRAVVTLFASGGSSLPEGINFGGEAVGAGFVLTSDGWVATHANALKPGARLVALVDGRRYPVGEAVRDPYSDVMFFRVEARDLPVPALARGEVLPTIGDSLFAFDATGGVRRLEVVNPQALGAKTEAELVVSSEKVSRLILCGRQPNVPVGAMVLDDHSEVVGVVASVSDDGVMVVPTASFSGVIEGVLGGDGPSRPYFGVRSLDLSAFGMRGVDGERQRGALLLAEGGPAVAKGSPSETVGLRAGDVVLAVNGEQVSSRHPLSEVIARYSPGMKVTVTYRRGDAERAGEATLAKQP